MGRPFHDELEKLADTYEWARSFDVNLIRDALRPLWAYGLITIGSGGSLSGAHFASALHENHTGNLSTVCTPLEFVSGSEARKSAAVLVLSAGGKNPDVLAATAEALRIESPWTTVLCGTRTTPLGRLARANELGSLVEYALPSGKDGFLATNSLFAIFTLLVRAYLPPRQELPPSLENLIGASDLTDFFRRATSGSIERLIERETLIVLYSSATKSAAIDLESKLTEAALARVQLADYRNFAHGRHHWLAKRGEETSLLALCTPADEEICRRTLALLPADVPQVVVNLSASPFLVPLHGLLYAFVLTQRFGKARGIDPGRPRVPEFGRKLYHLRTRRKKRSNDGIAPAISRKLRASHIPAGQADDEFWTACAKDQLDRLQGNRFEGVVLDYDGTLCSSQRRLEGPTPEIAEELIKLLEAGVSIGIATGRGRSVRTDLQKYLPKEHWSSIIVGYYNASDISTLDDDESPDRSETMLEPLKSVYASIRQDMLLRETCSWTVRPRQVTLEPHEWLRGFRLWERINGRLCAFRASGVRAVSSTHSVDVISPEVSKMNILSELLSGDAVSERSRILCIGDRGRWPGNDYELLAHTFALSADEVSDDPYSGWNFAPAGCRGTQATRHYLSRAKVESGGFRLRLEGVS